MSDYKDLTQFYKDSRGNTKAIRVGFVKDDKYITLDSLPIPRTNNFGELTVQLTITERRERGEGPPQQQAEPAAPPASDDIPF